MLSTSSFVDDASPIVLPMARGTVSIYVLQQAVINFQRIRQLAPQCLTLSSYTVAVNCATAALAMTTCGALPLPVPHLGTVYLTVSRTLTLLCKPSNATLRLSFFSTYYHIQRVLGFLQKRAI